MAKWTETAKTIGNITTVIISIIALYFSIENRPFLDPKVNYYFDQPSDGSNPKFIAVNSGDIPVRSFSVYHRTYIYSRKKQKIVISGVHFTPYSLRTTFKEVLKPNETVKTSLVKMDPGSSDRISIYKFTCRYFTGDQMERHEDEIIYFIENNLVSTHFEFTKDRDYNHILNEIDIVDSETDPRIIIPGK